MKTHDKTLSVLITGLGLMFTTPSGVQAQSYTNNYGIWAYTTTNGAITITGSTGSGGAVTIPDTINGLPVTSIGDLAFAFSSLTNVVIPLSKPGIVIGSIFVLTIVMGDFVTVGVMGGQQIASVGKMINTQMGNLQFPPAAAHAVVLLASVLVLIWGLTRLVDIRKEL